MALMSAVLFYKVKLVQNKKTSFSQASQKNQGSRFKRKAAADMMRPPLKREYAEAELMAPEVCWPTG
jgi:hypothetical protein